MPRVYIPMETQLSNVAQGRIIVRLHLDLEAYTIIRALAPSPHAYGELVSRMAYEFRARQEERQRLQAKLAAVVGEQ